MSGAQHSTRPRTPLTEQEAAQIADLRALGATPAQIAKQFDRHQDTISDLLRLGWGRWIERRSARAHKARRGPTTRITNSVSEQEASEMVALHALGNTPAQIAAKVGRHIETVRGILRLGWAGWKLRRQSRSSGGGESTFRCDADNDAADLDTADFLTVHESLGVRR